MRIIVYIIIVIFCLFGCQKSSKNDGNVSSRISENLSDEYSIQLVKTRDFHVISEDIRVLRGVYTPINIDPTGEFLAIENRADNIVTVLDSLGVIQTVIGSHGSGPEEFRNVYTLGFDDKGHIIIYDWELNLVKGFTVNGDLAFTFTGLLQHNLWARGKRIYGWNDHLYIAIEQADSQKHDSALFAKVNYEGELIELIGNYDEYLRNTDKFYIHPIIHLDYQNDRIYSTHRTSTTFQVFNLPELDKIDHFGFKPESHQESERVRMEDPIMIRREKTLNQYFSHALHSCSRYLYLHLFNSTEESLESRGINDMNHFIYLYDRNKNYAFLSALELPSALGGIDKSGNIYLIDDDNPDNFKMSVHTISEKLIEN